MDISVKIPAESYETLKRASKRSNVPIVKIIEGAITKENDWLDDPVKIAEYFKMCSEDK